MQSTRMLASCFLSILVLVFSACAGSSFTTMQEIPPSSPIRILSLGDSYTIGTSVADRERWPDQLAAALREKGYAVQEPVYLAQNGWTTGDLIAAIPTGLPAGDFDMVSLLIGVNNQYQGRDIDEYSRDFDLLLHLAIEKAGSDPGRVFVLSIPDWSVTPFAQGRERAKITAQIDLFNQANRRLSYEAGVHYIDITRSTRQLGGQDAFVAEDGLHPSTSMYAAWVDLLLPDLLHVLDHDVEETSP